MMHFLRLCNNVLLENCFCFVLPTSKDLRRGLQRAYYHAGNYHAHPLVTSVWEGVLGVCRGHSQARRECKGRKGRVWLPTSSAQGLPQPYWIVFVHPPPPLDNGEGRPPATNFNLLSSCHTYRFSSLWGPTHFSELVVLLIF